VRDAFGTVLWVVCAVGILAAVVALIGSGQMWKEYGKNRLVMDHELPAGPRLGSAAATLERDAEIRQLLEARNARLQRRGEAPIDIERELSRLTATQVDAGLQEEIRQLVIARNHRRARAGKPLLDVEAEIQREIDRFGQL
jgi:hypothetical protein